MRRIDYIVREEDGGKTVEKILRSHEYSTTIIKRQKLLGDGMLLNGARARTVDKVREGDTVSVCLHEESARSVPNPALSCDIVYEDEDVIVFDKPARMATHETKVYQTDTLANFFAFHMQKKGMSAPFRAVNRLDKDTMGLCVAAKNALCASKLAGKIYKEYLAVLSGRLEVSDGEIVQPIAQESGSIIKRCVSPSGQYAKTVFKVERVFEDRTLVRVWPETGRTHQIRLHFACIGHPLVGDWLYGFETPQNKTQLLCCDTVSFIHPVSGEKITCKSALSGTLLLF